MKLAVRKKLTFEPKDIKFIIVKRESEIPNMIKNIQEIFEDKATHKELMILYSKLISLEQIENDF